MDSPRGPRSRQAPGDALHKASSIPCNDSSITRMARSENCFNSAKRHPNAVHSKPNVLFVSLVSRYLKTHFDVYPCVSCILCIEWRTRYSRKKYPANNFGDQLPIRLIRYPCCLAKFKNALMGFPPTNTQVLKMFSRILVQ